MPVPGSDHPIKPIPLAIALLAFVALMLYPLFPGQANVAFAILLIAAILWMTEAVPLALTALLIPLLASLFKVLPVADAFVQFGNPVIFLFMGGFVLAAALTAHGLDRVLAHKLMGMANGNFYNTALLLMCTTAFLGCWIGNTSVAAMMLPLALGLLGVANKMQVTPESKFLVLGIAYSANVGGIITLIGTPPNAIGAALLNMSFSQWLMYGLPIFLITFPLMILTLTLYFRPDRKLTMEKIVLPATVGPAAKRLICIFILTAALWIADGFIAPLLGITSGFNSLVALFAIFLMVAIGVLKWPEVIAGIRWDVLLLFGGGLTLGVILERSGLGTILIGHIMSVSEAMPIIVFLWLIVLFSITLTEFMSNTASAALLLPMLYSFALHSGTNPVLMVLPATIAASYGFMLPVGTPPNALAFATGLIPQRDMIRVGLVINLLLSVVLTLIFYVIFTFLL